jgi:hypothetical protein
MHTTKQLSERCTRLLRTHLESGELEIARGRCDYLPSINGVPQGSGYTFLLVTSDRVLWTDYLGPERLYAERFSAIRSFSQGPYKHRWILLLRHGRSMRMESVSPTWYRPASWNAPPTEAPVERTETVLEFSRQRTAAAQAIVARLHELNIPEEEPLRFVETPRPTPVFLTAVPKSRFARWPRWRKLRRFGRG